MMKKYENLCDLLEQNPAARRVFEPQHDCVQESILERRETFIDERYLRWYAEKLLRGDD